MYDATVDARAQAGASALINAENPTFIAEISQGIVDPDPKKGYTFDDFRGSSVRPTYRRQGRQCVDTLSSHNIRVVQENGHNCDGHKSREYEAGT